MVTSVSVVMNGEEPQFTDAVGQVIPRPLVPPQVASPIDLLTPDRYEFYTFNDAGDLIKRLMTIKEIQSIVAGGDSEGAMILNSQQPNNEAQQKVQDIVDSVQNVLTTEMETKKNFTIVQPILDTPDVSSSWNMILPAIFGNTGDEILPHKPQQIVMTPDSTIVEATDRPIKPTAYSRPATTYSTATTRETTTNTSPATTTSQKANKISSTSTSTSTTASSTTTVTTFKPKTTARAPINQDNDDDEEIKTKNEPVNTVAFEPVVDNVTTAPETQENIKTTNLPLRKQPTIASLSTLSAFKNDVVSTVKKSTTSQTTATTQKPTTPKTSRPMTTASEGITSTEQNDEIIASNTRPSLRPRPSTAAAASSTVSASTATTAEVTTTPVRTTTEPATVSPLSRKPSPPAVHVSTAPIQQKKEEFIDIQSVIESLADENPEKIPITTEANEIEITTGFNEYESEAGSTEKYEYVTKYPKGKPDMNDFTTQVPTDTTTMMIETQDAINQIIGTLQFNNPSIGSLMFNNYPQPVTTTEPDYSETDSPFTTEAEEYVETTTEQEMSVNELDKIPSSHVFKDDTLFIEEKEPIVELIPTTEIPESDKLVTYNSFDSEEDVEGKATTTGRGYETTERFLGMTEQLIQTTITPDQLPSESINYNKNNEIVQLVDRYIETHKDHDIDASIHDKHRDAVKVMNIPAIKENRTMSQYKDQAATVASLMEDKYFDMPTTEYPNYESLEDQRQDKTTLPVEQFSEEENKPVASIKKEQEKPVLKGNKPQEIVPAVTKPSRPAAVKDNKAPTVTADKNKKVPAAAVKGNIIPPPTLPMKVNKVPTTTAAVKVTTVTAPAAASKVNTVPASPAADKVNTIPAAAVDNKVGKVPAAESVVKTNKVATASAVKAEKVPLAPSSNIKADKGPLKTEDKVEVDVVSVPESTTESDEKEAVTERETTKTGTTTTTTLLPTTTERIFASDSQKTTKTTVKVADRTQDKEAVMIEIATSKPENKNSSASTEILNASFSSLITQIINEDPSLVENPDKIVFKPFFHNDLTPNPEEIKSPNQFHSMEALDQVKDSNASETMNAEQNDATPAPSSESAASVEDASEVDDKITVETSVVKETSSVSMEAGLTAPQEITTKAPIQVIQVKRRPIKTPVKKVTKESEQNSEDEESENDESTDEEDELEDELEEEIEDSSEETQTREPQLVQIQIIRNDTANTEKVSEEFNDAESDEGVISGITSEILGVIGAVDEGAINDDDIINDDEEEVDEEDDLEAGASKQEYDSKQDDEESSVAEDETEEDERTEENDDDETEEDVSSSITSEIIKAASTIADSDETSENDEEESDDENEDEDEQSPVKYVLVKKQPTKVTKLGPNIQVKGTTPTLKPINAPTKYNAAITTRVPTTSRTTARAATSTATTVKPTKPASDEDSSIDLSDFIGVSSESSAEAESSTETESLASLLSGLITEDDDSASQKTKPTIAATTAAPVTTPVAEEKPAQRTTASGITTMKAATERIPLISAPISQTTITKKVGVKVPISSSFVRLPEMEAKIEAPVRVTENAQSPVSSPSLKVEAVAPQQLTPEASSQKIKSESAAAKLETETDSPAVALNAIVPEKLIQNLASATFNLDSESATTKSPVLSTKSTTQAIPIVRKDDSSEAADFEAELKKPTTKSEIKYVQLGETTTPSSLDVETNIRVSIDVKPVVQKKTIEKVKKEKIPLSTKHQNNYSVNRPSVIKPPPPSLQALKNNNNLKAAAAQTNYHSNSNPAPIPFELKSPPKNAQGLDQSISRLSQDVKDFTNLCNELAFNFWKSLTSDGNGISTSRSVIAAPYALISQLAMVFLGARGLTSFEMNELLKLDDMVTFNPHVVFKNITDSVEQSRHSSSVATAAFVRELYSDRSRGKLLNFFKDKSQQYYSSHVEEINFSVVNDIIRRRTNLLVKRHTNGKINEYLKTNNIWLNPPLAALSANIFEVSEGFFVCSHSSS